MAHVCTRFLDAVTEMPSTLTPVPPQMTALADMRSEVAQTPAHLTTTVSPTEMMDHACLPVPLALQKTYRCQLCPSVVPAPLTSSMMNGASSWATMLISQQTMLQRPKDRLLISRQLPRRWTICSKKLLKLDRKHGISNIWLKDAQENSTTSQQDVD